MQSYTDKNLAALEPLTPLNISAPCRYVRCNLSNRQVHADSEVIDCQTAQVLILHPESGEQLETPVYIGRGVGVATAEAGSCGIVTAEMVNAAKAQVTGSTE